MSIKYLYIILAACALAACGDKTPPAATSSSSSTAAAAPVESSASAPATSEASSAPAVASVDGEAVFKKTCALCHAAGVGGAPIPGHAEDWDARKAQGEDTLLEHALEGFNGSKGAMPAKGGNMALSDAEVKAAIDYMLSVKK